MQCKLCLQKRVLCESHIIPEFLYRPGYDVKGRMEVLRRTSSKTKYIQKGFRERLLCDECEGFLANMYEDYFAKLWYIQKPFQSPTTLDYISLSGLDYRLFKLFLLSLLWRASVSRLEPFTQVHLGPHEERVRTMLLGGEPGLPSQYQIFAAVVLFPGSHDILEGVIISPIANRFESRRIYMFLFGGCLWHFVVGDRAIQGFKQFALSEKGGMILPVRDFGIIKPLSGFFREHMQSPSV